MPCLSASEMSHDKVLRESAVTLTAVQVGSVDLRW